jgi:hypothetical protein
MSKKASLQNLQKEIYEQKIKILELEDEYVMMLYFETMPAYDPLYKYCYQTSNRKIPGYLQCIDHWVRAMIKHMGLRHRGHGGEFTKAVLISVPDSTTQKKKDAWLQYATNKLSKQVRIKKVTA